MKPSLQVRLSQHLALTPQLQQSIRLLQLSTLELQQEVEQMLDQNPFLEAEEEPAPAEAPAERRERPAKREAPAEAAAEREETTFDGGDEPNGIDGTDFGTPERRSGRTAPRATTSTASASCPAWPPRSAAPTMTRKRRIGPPPRRRCRTICAARWR